MSSHPGNTSRRQLKAIMFTDIAGYTALMQADEDKALRLLTRYRDTLAIQLTKHDGTLLQHVGDGSLTMFNSAVEAVRCAIDLQRTLQQEPVVPVRAGLHVGDIKIEGATVYGDGVNVASRIEQLADPGSVLITHAVYESIRNHSNLRVKYLGIPKLKNVFAPTRVYALRNRGLIVPERITRRISIDVRSVRRNAIIAAIIIAAIAVFGAIQLFGGKSNQGTTGHLPDVYLAPWQNLTGDTGFEELSRLVPDQLALALHSTGLVRIVSEDHPCGKDCFVLKGSCFRRHDVIIYQAVLYDGQSGDAIQIFEPYADPVASPAEAITDLTEEILGYWPVQGNTQARIPRYSAYQDYIRGKDMLFTNPRKAIAYFQTARQKDAGFVAPAIALIYAHVLAGESRQAIDCIAHTENLKVVSVAERRILNHWKAFFRADFVQAFDSLHLHLQSFPEEDYHRLHLARMALEHLQKPRTALELIEPLSGSDQFSSSDSHMILYQEILLTLHRYEQLAELTGKWFSDSTDQRILRNHIRALCRLEKHAKVQEVIRGCKDETLPFHCSRSLLTYDATIESTLMGDSSAMRNYLSNALGMTPPSKVHEAMLYFVGGHFHTAKAMFQEAAQTAGDSITLLDLSVKYYISAFESGDTSALEQFKLQIPAWEQALLPGLMPYQQARVALVLGEPEDALEYLEAAFKQGLPQRYGYFDTDVHLIPLFREQRFLRLTEAKD